MLPGVRIMAARKAFPLRINRQLYKELEAWAQEEFRSVNGQMEFLLRQAVLRRKRETERSTNNPEGESGK